MLGPILWGIYGSFTNSAISGAAATHPEFVGLDNYIHLFADADFPKSIWLTFLFVFFSAIIGQNCIGMLIAMLLRRMPKIACSFVSTTVIAAWIIPETAAGFVCYAFFNKEGTLNQLVQAMGGSAINWLYYVPMFAVILANVWRGTAFSMMNYQAALEDFDTSLSEAAAIDGANIFQEFFYVTLPTLKQTIVTNLMLITLQTLGSFSLIWVMTEGGPGTNSTTMPIYTYKMAFRFGDIGYGTALSIVLLIVGAIFGIVYMRVLNGRRGSR